MLWNPEAETMDRDRLRDLQAARLREKVAYVAARVPFYRERFAAHGIVPDAVHSLDDLGRLPFTTKSDLRDNYPFGLFATPQSEVVRLHASSGTKGKLTVVGYTRHDLGVWAEVCARALALGGGQPGDVVHNAYGYGLFTGGLGAHYGAERLGAVVVPVSGGSTERQVQLLVDFRSRVLCSTPSYALTIAEVAERLGVDLRASALEVGLFGAEPWSAGMRSEIESRLGLRAVDVYGLSEIMGPGLACECEARNGLHGWEDHFLFEVIDPASGKPLPEGEAGELVITTLTKEALPMLRYRTRDITRLASGRCDCGRTHQRILRITGRNDDMLIIRGVNVYPSQLEAALIGRPGIAPYYQLVVERRGALDHVDVEVEAQAGIAVEAHAAIASDVAHHIKSMIGITTEVRVRAPGEIPRSEGKAVRVRDLRPKAQS